MPKSISWKKFIQQLKLLGFIGPYAGGRHLFMVKGTLKLHIPNQHRGDISKHLLSEILRQAEISISEWNRHL
ncbi:MAG: type II toxin-antitoxin system HicA family toxin [Candidatus Magasanikbacteria bacterium]|nr:type II toxin-antitoxin system HicA family toxin [Candidatus Magasanikbacteria bacterium]